jgi:3-hydroxyacyl-CoA dehydrogenase
VPLVELAPGALTAPEPLQRAAAFYTAVGKVPVKLTRDLPGYLANRLSAALWREAVDLVLRGVATVDDVDKAVSYGPGLRWAAMGPHLLYDLGGGLEGIRGHVEHLAAVKEGMLRDLATWTEFPPDTGAALEAGLTEEKGARSYEDLVAERDALLVAYLRAEREVRGR